MSTAHTPPKRNRPLISTSVLILIIALIGVFLGMILPVTGFKRKSRIAQANLEMSQLVNAVSAYQVEYGRMPLTPTAAQAARPDFTWSDYRFGSQIVSSQTSHQANNSELTAVLCDLEYFRDGKPTVNAHHARNPKKIAFFECKQVKGPRPGMDEHGVLRDPWGNPYIITIDANDDSVCEDPLHGRVKAKVFVWSFGPDGKADLKMKATEGANADNVTTLP